jgi:signal transduction histidine kinase
LEQIAEPAGDVAPANVVPFRPAAAADSKPGPSLTPVERRAFRELAQELTSRLRGTQVAATAEALAQELAGQDQALSQDELRQALSQALNRENDEQFRQEMSQESAQDVSAERGKADEQANEEPDRTENQERRPDTPPDETASEQPNAAGDEQADPSGTSLQQPLIEPALLDRIPLGILIYRHDALLYANRQFLDLSGYDDVAAIEAAGGLNRLFAGPADAAFADNDLAQSSAQTLAILARSGERVPVEGRMITVPWNASPALALFVEKQSDATVTAPAKRNDAEIGAAQRDDEAEPMAAAKAEFVARLNHDIRNPLNAITGFAEAIMSERFGPIGNERYRENIKDLHAAAAHMSSTIDDLLDLTKPESGRIALTFASVNLNELIQQCVGTMQPQANRARIIIRSALTSGLPLVKADERALRQIVLNLLSNSIKSTGPGGQIIVSTVFSDRREAILRVRDTGVGMSERQIVAALAPAADIDAWTSSGSGGTELDLPLTKALTEANHAQFRIKSAPEAGTLVEIAFAPSRTLAA